MAAHEVRPLCTTAADPMIRFTLDGQAVGTQAAGGKPLPWVLREDLQLTGTRFGCGVAQCSARTVHVNGAPACACVRHAGAGCARRETDLRGRRGAAEQPRHLPAAARQCDARGRGQGDADRSPGRHRRGRAAAGRAGDGPRDRDDDRQAAAHAAVPGRGGLTAPPAAAHGLPRTGRADSSDGLPRTGQADSSDGPPRRGGPGRFWPC